MKLKSRGVLALPALVAVVLAAGLAPGPEDSDDSPIQKLMDQIHARNRAIGKGLRAPAALAAAGRKALAADAASLIRLGQEARTLTGPAQARKKSQQDWTRAVDAFDGASNGFAKVIADAGSDRHRATQSHQKLQTTCTNCHSAFRQEAD
jgi:hypothetical protein